MAKNDYFVVVYRVLKYLYACLKVGKKPQTEALDPDFLGVDETYWVYILRNLKSDGYISGICIKSLLGQTDYISHLGQIEITPKGIQYLDENSAFNKVKGYVKDIADIIPHR